MNLTIRSPEILAPAKIPVAAGKKMAKTEKKVSSSLKSGPMFSIIIAAVKRNQTSNTSLHIQMTDMNKREKQENPPL